jgi:hypothetical protein
MRQSLLILAVAGLAVAGGGVGAQPAAHAADPEASISDEFVAHGRLAGPAWWTVSKGASKVYVLGVPSSLPKGMAWDASVLKQRLQGANEMIGRPTISADPGDILLLGKLHSDAPMEDSLPPPLRARLAQTEARLGLEPGRYRHWVAVAASLRLVMDYRVKQQLAPAEPGVSIEKMARQAGLKVQPIAVYKAGVLMRAITPQMGAVGAACVADALDEIDAGAAGPRAAAAGWAKGDPRAALAEARGYEKCFNALPDGAAMSRRAMEDTANAIAAALGKPGHSLAVVNLRTLLAQGGALQKLRARGYTVTTPQDD